MLLSIASGECGGVPRISRGGSPMRLCVDPGRPAHTWDLEEKHGS